MFTVACAARFAPTEQQHTAIATPLQRCHAHGRCWSSRCFGGCSGISHHHGFCTSIVGFREVGPERVCPRHPEVHPRGASAERQKGLCRNHRPTFANCIHMIKFQVSLELCMFVPAKDFDLKRRLSQLRNQPSGETTITSSGKRDGGQIRQMAMCTHAHTPTACTGLQRAHRIGSSCTSRSASFTSSTHLRHDTTHHDTPCHNTM